MTLTNTELVAIRERDEKATKGKTPEWYIDEDYPDLVRDSWSADLIAQSIKTMEDAEFIAHAREDIPKLLAEVERLRAVIKDAEYDIGNIKGNMLGNLGSFKYVSINFEDLISIREYLSEAIDNG